MIEHWKAKALLWKKVETDSNYQKKLDAIIADPQKLEEYFGSRLEFGTAGLRGEMGPGPNRMNDIVVHQTSLAIARYIKSSHKNPSVVIGYDARNKSDVFANIATRVFSSEGIKVHLFSEIVATPLLAHAVVKYSASAGVMITASHNPPKDNGYKVYWSNGAQIIPPHDTNISRIFDELPFPPEPLKEDSSPDIIPEHITQDYLAEVQELRVHNHNDLRIVYTPLHGVGGAFIQKTLSDAGYTDVHVVNEQFQPDGNFPYAPFPNPEDEDSMNLAFELAQKIEADIIIANDPDADRLAVAIRIGDSYQKLTGDQVGLLLANDLLKHRTWNNPMIATTIVSSSQLRSIAKEYNCTYVETLTGFKWIANAAINHDGDFVIGFEEALGYSVHNVARDKDGISASLLICDLASFAKSQGKTLKHFLADIYSRHGFALSAQKSLRKPGSAGKKQIAEILDNLRADPPTEIAGSKVLRIIDVLRSIEIECTHQTTQSIDLPKSNVLIYHLENHERVIVRPSGTEPKIKFYFETQTPISDISQWEKAYSSCEERIKILQQFFLPTSV